MKFNYCLLIILIITVLSSCKTENEKQIVGKWHAERLVECDEIIPIDTSLVNLEFLPDGRYVFNSTLKVHEEGKYHLQDNYLFTHDLLNPKAPQNAVLIKVLSPDSLVLEMNQKGKEQWLTLYRDTKGAFAQKETQKEPQKASIEAITPPNVATNLVDSVGSTTPSALSNTASIIQPPLSTNESAIVTNDKKSDNTDASANLSPSEAAEVKRKADREAYLEREEKRKEEADAKRKSDRAAYLKREEKRRDDEADRKRERAEYLKREAARKKKKK